MFKNILVAVNIDKLHLIKSLLDRAYNLLDHQDNRAIIRICGVVPATKNTIVSSFLPKNFDKEVLNEANIRLHKATEIICGECNSVQHIVCYGEVSEEILKYLNQFNCDLVIVGATESNKETLSSNSVKITRQAKCDVLIVRQ